ncbi:MAG TPA: hypothetical protein VE219_04140 [Candidatus Sulfotelmatobacter sp.]|nr:hypothetical protein [Candidatus Sulfotelmatobacter sp.]
MSADQAEDRAGNPVEKAADRLDEEMLAQRGETASRASLEDEAHPEVQPDTPQNRVEKLKDEVSEGEGLAGKAKRALEELDRDVSGEYERREDAEAPKPPEAKR